MIEIIGYNEIIEVRNGYDHGSRDMTQYYIYYKEDNKTMLCKLDNDYGDCSSGRTSATWGRREISEVKSVGSLQYIPRSKIKLDSIENFILVDYDGGDNRYPSGFAQIQSQFKDSFTKTNRAKDKRQVYLFTGKSGTGKSYLAHKTDVRVYETDSSDELEYDIQKADIIVLGNKYSFTVNEIKEKVGGYTDFILVNFNYEN